MKSKLPQKIIGKCQYPTTEIVDYICDKINSIIDYLEEKEPKEREKHCGKCELLDTCWQGKDPANCGTICEKYKPKQEISCENCHYIDWSDEVRCAKCDSEYSLWQPKQPDKKEEEWRKLWDEATEYFNHLNKEHPNWWDAHYKYELALMAAEKRIKELEKEERK